MIKQPGPSEPGHHHRTPALTVTDPRGLAVRAVEYRRSSADAQAIEQATRYRHDARGWPVAEIDPRLSAPNQRTVFSLSGVVVLLESVDAGWRLSLTDENANTVDRWDGRYSHWRTVFDDLARPVAIYEKGQTQTEHRVTGRLSYAAFSEQAALHNQCGRLIRQDDAAGTCLFADYAVTGISLSETRHFLNQLDPPNWPLPVPAPVQTPVQEPGAQLETGNGATTLWRCNTLGERLSQIDAMGHQQLTAYTVAGELKGATVQWQHGLPVTVMHRVIHGASGQIEQQTLGCGVTRCHFYDPADGRLKRLVSRRPGSTLQALDYTYDPVGNVVQITDLAQPERHFTHQHISATNTYRYDSLYQLIEATGRESMGALIGPQLPGRMPNPGDLSQLLNYCQTYDYDTAGNLIQLRHIGHESYTRTLQVAPDSNRGMPATGGREIENRFDANGNLQTLQPGQTLEWDLSNQLSRTVQVIRSQGLDDDERYIYDAQGQRLRKITTRHNKAAIDISDARYLPGLEIHTREGQCLHIVIAAGVRCLHWEVGNPHAPANDVLRYSLDDHLGSSTLEVDKNAAIISHEGYYPFGGTAWWSARSGVEAAYKTIRYSGKERDASGLYYYGFRYYAPWLARWINPDPAGDVDGLNLFRMLRNSPMRFKDESGLDSSEARAEIKTFKKAKKLAIERMGQAQEFLKKEQNSSTALHIGQIFFGGTLDVSYLDRWSAQIEKVSDGLKQLKTSKNIEYKKIKATNEDAAAELDVLKYDNENNSRLKYMTAYTQKIKEISDLPHLGVEHIAHIAIHELSHGTLKTEDVKYILVKHTPGYHNLVDLAALPMLEGEIAGEPLTQEQKLKKSANINLSKNNADSFTTATRYLAYAQKNPRFAQQLFDAHTSWALSDKTQPLLIKIASMY